MNTKIARALSLLFQLSDEDRTFVFRLWNMSEVERESLIEALQPDKSTTKKAGKKSSMSKSSQSSSKSPRASGMATQLSNRRQRRQKINEGACTFILEDGAVCNTGDNNPIHDESFGYAHYHPFQPSTTAPPAPVPSSANGGAGSTTANSETQPEDVGTVAHGASGGD